ncbi:hypothetical protein J5N97_023834 [Dioscorea zingiberensis]|uniref:Smr domain-containing protein n=1 Tax=Dioscorea zingiberensis TaxID=325984 RepID=A0A9D5H8D0_9LILI|nr:hypothetical protein J5N97_023834 [Dioscorea zingiberensis]
MSMLNHPRDLASFYCDLIDAFSQRGLKDRVLEIYARVRGIRFPGRRPFETMVKALCLMGMPKDAERMLDEMQASGFKPSAFEFRSVMQGYGQLGSFSEMQRVIGIMERAGHPVDVVCANIVLSCYGDRGQLSEMISWLQYMKRLKIGFSVRTFNSVLNSCLTIVPMAKNFRPLPLSVGKLVEKVSNDEALLVHELLESPLLDEMLEWSSLEGKLDLHGFHVASTYVILLQWMEVLRGRFRGDGVVPCEISLVCGSGKHSSKVGESPVKMLVSEMLFQLRSPLRMDRRNVGRFVAKGKAVRNWLMC